MGWMAFILSLLLWALAVLVGAYRQFCIQMDLDLGGINTPLIWRSPIFRLSTWVAVATFSVIASAIFAILAERFLPGLVAGFLFGVLLVVRWVISLIIAAEYSGP